MSSGFVITEKAGLCFRIVEDLLELGVGSLESSRVPFLTRRLMLLVILYAFAVEGFAGSFGLIEIAEATTIGFSMNFINGSRWENL